MTARYRMGVDGGGTGTRLLLTSAEGRRLGEGRAGPSALGQGVEQAWRHILQAATQAVADAVSRGFLPAGTVFNEAFMRQTRIGMGLSGAENPAWVAAFGRSRPIWDEARLVSDGLTTMLGAHGGGAGAVVTVGTGSVGVALQADERVTVIGGWGWQLGDEGSGAWLGRQAVTYVQHAMDGREPGGPLVQAIAARCGRDRSSLLDWCAQAGQGAYAELAPLVFALEATDPYAARLTDWAARCVEDVVRALDPPGVLALVVCGSVGNRLASRLSPDMVRRMVVPKGDACEGALLLLEQHRSFLDDCHVLQDEGVA
jgi:glucosamine kinase